MEYLVLEARESLREPLSILRKYKITVTSNNILNFLIKKNHQRIMLGIPKYVSSEISKNFETL
jgi:hypothetical protein